VLGCGIGVGDDSCACLQVGDAVAQDDGANRDARVERLLVGQRVADGPGIRPAPGSIAFRDIVIRPEPVGDVTAAKASYLSPYGEIVSDWKKEDNTFTLRVRIPANAHATIYLPAESTSDVTVNGVAVAIEKGYKEGRYVMETGSGEYLLHVVNRRPVTSSAGSYAGR